LTQGLVLAVIMDVLDITFVPKHVIKGFSDPIAFKEQLEVGQAPYEQPTALQILLVSPTRGLSPVSPGVLVPLPWARALLTDSADAITSVADSPQPPRFTHTS